ncbi:MAG TPA: copper chaperone PCu(A)C [Chitinolyticbacter sp.]|nr:copper chaperone PCu(A)C [Chitinolyticbacter sp.]
MTRTLAGFCLAVLAVLGHAHEYEAGKLLIGHPWARATAPGAPVAGVFLTLENGTGDADRLTGGDSAVAQRVELHAMTMDNGMMKMRHLEAIEVPAKGAQKLAPGGLHIMLFGLKAPLKEGDSFPLTLHFERAGKVKVNVKVEPMGATAPAHGN